MPDLRTDLRALAADLDWPPTPDLATAVRDRLPAGSDPLRPPASQGSDPLRRPHSRGLTLGWGRRRLVLALAVALLVLPAATALAIPGSRHAILDALGLRHVSVERRAVPPPAATDPRLGARTTLAGAARAAGFTPLVPAALGPPQSVHEREHIITLVYARSPAHPRGLLLAQAEGRLPQRDVLRKVVGVDDRAVRTTVGGAPALFLAAGHAYAWTDATGPLVRSGPALVWERGDRVLRLEGAPSLRAARAIAGSVR
jgi:hypothetical protein